MIAILEGVNQRLFMVILVTIRKFKCAFTKESADSNKIS